MLIYNKLQILFSLLCLYWRIIIVKKNEKMTWYKKKYYFCSS